MSKKFQIAAENIKTLVSNMGSCYASDMITVDGLPVGYMYREPACSPTDSGWRFFSGHETQEYVDNPANIEIYDVNTICNYDRNVIPFLNYPPQTAFERHGDAFREVHQDS